MRKISLKKILFKLSNYSYNSRNLKKIKSITLLPQRKILLDNKLNIHGENNSITLEDFAQLKNSSISIFGDNNTVIIGKHSIFTNAKISIMANNSVLKIGERCENIHGDITFNLENNGTKITVGDNTHFYYGSINISAQESNKIINIGKDCVISHHVDIKTSDSHSILDKETGKRINYGKDIVIGNHVWIAPHVTILKGSVIQDDSIIGTRSVVTKPFSKNGVIVGIPAKLIKENVTWTTENILEQ